MLEPGERGLARLNHEQPFAYQSHMSIDGKASLRCRQTLHVMQLALPELREKAGVILQPFAAIDRASFPPYILLCEVPYTFSCMLYKQRYSSLLQVNMNRVMTYRETYLYSQTGGRE